MAPVVAVAWPATDLTAIASVTQSADFFDTDWRFGWDFTVGSSAITVTALRAYSREAHTYRVRIHRVSDGALMATADIAGVASSWEEESVTPVALSASTKYAITARRVDSTGMTEFAREPTSVAYASEVTYENSRWGYETDPDDMPSTTNDSVVYTNTDFRFTV